MSENNVFEKLTSDSDVLDSCFDYIESMEKEELIAFAKSFFKLKLQAESLKKNLSKEDRLEMDLYLKLELTKQQMTKQDSFLGDIEYLTLALKSFTDLINKDQEVMSELAQDDPGAYSKLLAYRRKFVGKKKSFGLYTENLLSNYLSGDKSRFDKDHSHWALICESKVLEEKSARVSTPLSQLTISSAFDS